MREGSAAAHLGIGSSLLLPLLDELLQRRGLQAQPRSAHSCAPVGVGASGCRQLDHSTARLGNCGPHLCLGLWLDIGSVSVSSCLYRAVLELDAAFGAPLHSPATPILIPVSVPVPVPIPKVSAVPAEQYTYHARDRCNQQLGWMGMSSG